MQPSNDVEELEGTRDEGAAEGGSAVAQEHEILALWERERTFDRLREKNRSGPVFRFIDGPITANNPMGVHHVWGRTLKDAFLRYKAMHGFTCNWQNGFDAQGLWVEVEVERELGFGSKRDIEAYGVAEFVQRCKERVAKYSGVQTQQSIRLGQWMDWSRSYYTNTDTNIQGIWAFLRRCHENGWIYRKLQPLAWCPRCGTSLSEHEMQGSHRETTHTAVVVTLPFRDRPGRIAVWTTTPWTLPSNVALAVNPAIHYVEVELPGGGDTVVVAEAALPFMKLGEARVLRTFPGTELVGLRYETFFPDLPVQQPVEHRVVPWADVDPAEGTGVVHISPGAGPEDYALGQEVGLPTILSIDESAVYLDGFAWLSGRQINEATDSILERLRADGKLFRADEHRHAYPVCWRCKTETVFRLVHEWFIGTDSLRPRLLSAAAGVRWEPEHIGKRMEDWLANMGDWNISRKRFYGLPLPFYPCEACGELTVVGSRAELLALADAGEGELTELHRPGIDALTIRCPGCGGRVARVTEVGDVWLDAGIVPFSTLGWLDDRERWRTYFPAEWITEMREQVRLWFYSMLFMSVTLYDRAPYERVLSYESVVGEDKRRFSKTGYMIEFNEAAERLGADVIRYLFARANVTLNVRFGFALGEEVRRQLLALENAVTFFTTYAAVDRPDLAGYRPKASELSSLDRWLVARANRFLRQATASYDAYVTSDVVRGFEEFMDDLNNWYIRVNRRRFWRDAAEADKRVAYWTLHSALRMVAQVMAPIIPFMTERIWRTAILPYAPGAADSVHLSDWPRDLPYHERSDEVLAEMEIAREVVSSALRLRNEYGIKVRQPLATLHVVTDAAGRRAVERLRDTIAEQVNVRELALIEDVDELQERYLGVDFPRAGRELKGRVQELKAVLAALTPEASSRAARQAGRGDPVELPGWEGDPLPAGFFTVQSRPREGLVTASSDHATVALDTQLTPDLVDEGLARDVVRNVQVLRKDAGLRIEQRIALSVWTESEELLRALEAYAGYVREQTLAVRLDRAAPGGDGTEVSIAGHAARISFAPVASE